MYIAIYDAFEIVQPWIQKKTFLQALDLLWYLLYTMTSLKKKTINKENSELTDFYLHYKLSTKMTLMKIFNNHILLHFSA